MAGANPELWQQAGMTNQDDSADALIYAFERPIGWLVTYLGERCYRSDSSPQISR